MDRKLLALLISATGLVAELVGCSGPRSSFSPGLSPASATSPAPNAGGDRSNVDYLILVPRELRSAIEPLAEWRSKHGHSVRIHTVEEAYAKNPDVSSQSLALLADIRAAVRENPSLHYLLLAGDPHSANGALPTFHRPLGAWAGAPTAGSPFPTDQPYALFGEHPLAVGRLPARTPAELGTMVDKIVAYESGGPEVTDDRVLVFGSPANFGPTLDTLIEGFATSLLDRQVPHDLDLSVLFAQPSSPYTFRLDRLGNEMSRELGEGALLAVFVGHGSPRSLDSIPYRRDVYPMAHASDFANVQSKRGNSIFLAITCSAGSFDDDNRSIVETAILNPHGSVASLGASTFSGAYVNTLLSQELLRSFLIDRVGTVGDAVLDAKRGMGNASSLLRYAFPTGGEGDMATDDDAVEDHLFIYNLFADPATPPLYPERAETTVDALRLKPDQAFEVVVTLSNRGFSEVDAFIEMERTNLKPGIVSPGELDKLDLSHAFATMEKNHALAVDKVISNARASVDDRTARVTLHAPHSAGSYWIRTRALGNHRMASGFVHVDVE